MRLLFVWMFMIPAVKIYPQADYIPMKATIPVITTYSSRLTDALQFDVNQASVAFTGQTLIAIYNERRFLMKELSLTKAAFVFPLKSGVYGCSFAYAGNQFHNETRFALGYSRKLSGMVSMGMQFSYLVNRSYTQPATISLSADAGIFLKLSENLQAGFQLANLLRSTSKTTNDRLPVSYSFGIGYDVSEKLLLTAMIEKQAAIPSNLTVAMRYAFIPAFFVQGGITNQLHQLFLGLGLQWKKRRMELNAIRHYQLGITPGLSLIFQIGKAEE